MDDRTLIERAAKAAGKHAVEWVEPGQINDKGGFVQFLGLGRVETWHPLADDADIARLEAVIGLDTFWNKDYVEVYCPEKDPFGLALVHEMYAAHNGDKQKARRYASTRAAASLAMGE